MPTQMHETLERGLRSRPQAREDRRRDMPIDWAHLSRFTLNDRALEREVLGLFANEAPRYLSRLKAAADRKEWMEAAHTLKGSARAVGAWAIAECAQAAETLQLSAEREAAVGVAATPGAGQALERLDEAVSMTLAYIEEMIGISAATSAPQSV